jgi:glycosyltransferase involved in cell wall biosynthesis
MFEYDLSIVIPVYNAEEFIVETMNSIFAQNTKSYNIQIILIDDGSSDRSLEICKAYQEKYPKQVVCIANNHLGVSGARNSGIRFARGKYIMFLDSDDLLQDGTIPSLIGFFDKNYDKVDIITYPILIMRDTVIDEEHGDVESPTNDEENIFINEKGEKVLRSIQQHPRNKNFEKEGIYDVSKHPFLSQLTMNIVVKNYINDANKIYFNEDLAYYEDTTFITEYIMRKQSLGFCKTGGYLYRKSNFSTIEKFTSPVDSYDLTIEYANSQFDTYRDRKGNVPKYVQANILYELRWRYFSKNFIPYHLPNEELVKWQEDIKKIMLQIDDDMIFNAPLFDRYHRYSFLRLKEGLIHTAQNPQELYFYHNGKLIGKEVNFETVITDISFQGDVFYLSAFLKIPMQEDLNIRIFAYENNKRRELPTFSSSYSYHRKREKSNEFMGFKYRLDISSLFSTKEVHFTYEINGFEYPIKKTYFLRNRLFPFKANINSITHNNVVIDYKKVFSFLFTPKIREDIEELNTINNEKVSKVDEDLVKYREYAQQETKEDIWLYTDRIGILDNGYFQFMNDIKKNDGIQRYYIYEGNFDDIADSLIGVDPKNIVEYGTDLHKELFMKAKIILFSFQGFTEYCPFSKEEYEIIKDCVKSLFVYLQHGILHAHTPWIYSREVSFIDRFVVSSEFERNNLISNYAYEDFEIIKTGMPRFSVSTVDTERETNNKILFAPSWRSSLIKGQSGNNWIVDEEALKNSAFYSGIKELFSSIELNKFLEDNNLYFDIKLHPIFSGLESLIDEESERIRFVQENDDIGSYYTFITDFSSFVFDAVYHKTPIIYYVSDYSYFRCGNHSYSELDIPLDKGFGDLVTDVPNLVQSLSRIQENNGVPEEKYLKMMDDFYSFPKDVCNSLYEELRKEN